MDRFEQEQQDLKESYKQSLKNKSDRKVKGEISGYYFNGEKSYILYKDEYGNETMKEWSDEW